MIRRKSAVIAICLFVSLLVLIYGTRAILKQQTEYLQIPALPDADSRKHASGIFPQAAHY